MPYSQEVMVYEIPKPSQVIEWMDDVVGFIHTEAYSEN